MQISRDRSFFASDDAGDIVCSERVINGGIRNRWSA